jgi:hypothetical protein
VKNDYAIESAGISSRHTYSRAELSLENSPAAARRADAMALDVQSTDGLNGPIGVDNSGGGVEDQGQVRSVYGEAIIEVIDQGWGLRQVARHVGCDVATISRVRDDPRVTPNYQLGELILELRDNLRAGISKWGRVIIALRAHGFSTSQIAFSLDVTMRTIQLMETDPTSVPQHDTAGRLLDLYRRHITSKGLR